MVSTQYNVRGALICN